MNTSKKYFKKQLEIDTKNYLLKEKNEIKRYNGRNQYKNKSEEDKQKLTDTDRKTK